MEAETEFAQQLRALASERDFSQAEIARRSKLSRSTVNRIFNGREPTVEQLEQLAAVFEVSTDTLVGSSDATSVLAQAKIGPTAEQHRQVLEEAARVKAELLSVKAELNAERERRKESVSARLAAERLADELRAEIERARVIEQQLRGRLQEAQAFGDKWAETSLGQTTHINALEEANRVLARDYAATAEHLQRYEKAYQLLAKQYQQLQRSNQALAHRKQADPNAAVLTGLLGFAFGRAMS